MLGHKHLNELISLTHVEPVAQGDGRHSSMSVSHCFPVKPGKQSHLQDKQRITDIHQRMLITGDLVLKKKTTNVLTYHDRSKLNCFTHIHFLYMRFRILLNIT